jgi:hypothetical protein
MRMTCTIIQIGARVRSTTEPVPMYVDRSVGGTDGGWPVLSNISNVKKHKITQSKKNIP